MEKPSADAKQPRQILVVDDEPDVIQLVSSNLKTAGFDVLQAQNGMQAMEMARNHNPSLVVLDVMLPGMSGTEICKALKADRNTMNIPVIMLTARAEEVDRVVGFELGADDYVSKPFSPRELILRINAVLRRNQSDSSMAKTLEFGMVVLDRRRNSARVKGEDIGLTSTEFKLLNMLMENAGQVQSRDDLLKEVWGYQGGIDTRTVDTHIRRLRDKLGTAGNCIATFRGFGYCFFYRES
jgi:two-component system, OmpR family, phosphate regulon response regulator PhoB